MRFDGLDFFARQTVHVMFHKLELFPLHRLFFHSQLFTQTATFFEVARFKQRDDEFEIVENALLLSKQFLRTFKGELQIGSVAFCLEGCQNAVGGIDRETKTGVVVFPDFDSLKFAMSV